MERETNPNAPLLIVGLGNPGLRYRHTRHNVGFLVLDELQKQLDFPRFSTQRKFHGTFTRDWINDRSVILLKPRTFMNESGRAIRAITQFYKIPTENIWVVHDDKDLVLGKVRTRFTGSSGGHNGVQNIINVLKTKDFKRYKVGIAPLEGLDKDTADFVLERFKAEESAELKKIILETVAKIRSEI